MHSFVRYIPVLVIASACLLAQNVDGTPLQPQEPKPSEVESRLLPEEYRLNDDVWPTHYDIEITPYFEAEGDKKEFTFDGSTTITVVTEKDNVTQIKLHKARMDILFWSVVQKSNSQVVRPVNETYQEETQMLTLHLSEPLVKNEEYYVTFNYVGLLEQDMGGFYRSYYTVNGTKVWLGSTQFEQTEARRAFPCFDEPKFKATFMLMLNYNPLKYSVFSNTPIKSSANVGNNRTLATFAITPKMSTYLLAFVVAPYKLTGEDDVAVLSRPEAANQTNYSVAVGQKLLKKLGEWIDYPYNSVPEISRMYMAAVPDFSAGAMENWGLITYRESSLLYVEQDATSMQQQRIATIISHELAHQWFGNLVTCEWWDVTWLNEGFATYLEYFGTALVESTWELDHQFVVEKLQSAMQMDSMVSTHPMTHTVYTQAEASTMFDAISYNKGGVVLRMTEHFLSKAVFMTALRDYVKERQFKPSRPENLFAALDSLNVNASAFMKLWTTQPGFPLVTVTGNENGFTLTQQRFFANGTNQDDKLLWPLPITYATDAAQFSNTKPLIVETESYNISVVNASELQYFVLNNQQVGYYRVNYDAPLWGKISRALQSEGFGGIHVLNRAQIVDDLFNLARADLVSYSKALDMLDYLKEETEYVPWLAALNGLNVLALRIHNEDEKMFSHHVLDILAKVYGHVEFRTPTLSDRRVDTYLRRFVLEWACRHGHDDCIKSAVDEFERFRANPSVKVHPDLRQVVYCEGVRRGTEQQFDTLLNLYLTTNVATEQQLTLQGMSCASEKALIYKYMNLTSSPDVRSQDKSTALSLVLSNQNALESVTSYLVSNSERWAEAHGGYEHVAVALSSVLVRVKDAAIKDTIGAYAEANKEILGAPAFELIAKGLTEFEANQQFTLNHRDEIREFLKQKSGSGSTQTVIVNVAMALCLALLAMCRV